MSRDAPRDSHFRSGDLCAILVRKPGALRGAHTVAKGQVSDVGIGRVVAGAFWKRVEPRRRNQNFRCGFDHFGVRRFCLPSHAMSG